MNKRKYLLSILIFVIIIFLTFYTIFSKNDISKIINTISNIKIKYIIFSIIFIIIYFFLQALYMKIILKSLKYNLSIKDGVFYSMIEFFFSAITPSASGGQPVQLYCMKKDKIPIKKSLITLILNTIYFKLILFIFSIVIIFFYSNIIFSNIYLTITFCLGFIVDLVIILLGFLILFKQEFVKKILYLFYKIKNKIIKSKEEDINNIINNKLKSYNNEIDYIKSHNKEVILGFFITLLQRLFMFSIVFFVYKSFNLDGYSYFYLIIIQIIVQVSIEGILLPGGAGLSEYLLTILFSSIFGSNLAISGMLINRLLIFYIPLILSLIILIIRCIKNKGLYIK